MKLTFWKVPNLFDSSAYDIRTKTKKEALEQLSHRNRDEYGDLQKVTFEYKDSFELMEGCLSEERGNSLRINR